jgi:hypothetical protein
LPSARETFAARFRECLGCRPRAADSLKPANVRRNPFSSGAAFGRVGLASNDYWFG